MFSTQVASSRYQVATQVLESVSLVDALQEAIGLMALSLSRPGDEEASALSQVESRANFQIYGLRGVEDCLLLLLG